MIEAIKNGITNYHFGTKVSYPNLQRNGRYNVRKSCKENASGQELPNVTGTLSSITKLCPVLLPSYDRSYDRNPNKLERFAAKKTCTRLKTF